MAKRPPSSGTSGRSSGGITGTTSRIIHSGRLPERMKDSTSFSRLTSFLRLASELVTASSPRSVSRSSERSRLGQHGADHLGADAGLEGVGAELVLRLAELILGEQLVLLQRRHARLGDDVALEVEDPLHLLERHVEEEPDAGRHGFEEPDVGDRRGQLDMAHALAPDLGLDHLDAALLADDAAVFHALVLAAQALVILDRSENAGAEQAVALGLEGAVVDGLRLLDLAVGPGPDLLRARDRDLDLVELLGGARRTEDIDQLVHQASSERLPRCRGAVPGASQLRCPEIDIEAEGLHLLDQDVEGFRNSHLEILVAAHDRLVDLGAARDVVRLDGQHFLERVGGAVGLERPHLHLAEALAAELRLAAERLLGDEAVGPDRAGVDLVVDQVVELQHVDVADRDRAVEGLAGLPVDQAHLAARFEAGELQHLHDVRLVGAVEHRARHGHAAPAALAEPGELRVRHGRDPAVGVPVAVIDLGEEAAQRAVRGAVLRPGRGSRRS